MLYLFNDDYQDVDDNDDDSYDYVLHDDFIYLLELCLLLIHLLLLEFTFIVYTNDNYNAIVLNILLSSSFMSLSSSF